MLYKRKGTALFFDVTNPELIPLYEGNEAYELVPEEKKAEKPVEKKTAKK